MPLAYSIHPIPVPRSDASRSFHSEIEWRAGKILAGAEAPQLFLRVNKYSFHPSHVVSQFTQD